MRISDLYGKNVLTTDGRKLGLVEEVILNLEDGNVSHLLFSKLPNIQRSDDLKNALMKNSVAYKRVRSIEETIIVSSMPAVEETQE